MIARREDVSFLNFLLDSASELEKLLGDQWPVFAQLLDRARGHYYRAPHDADGLRRALDDLLDFGLASPAALQIRHLLNEARADDLPLPPPGLRDAYSVSVTQEHSDPRIPIEVSGSAASEDPGAQERRISAWIGEREEDPREPLRMGQTYTLKFKVGRPVAFSLLTGPDSIVPSSDVPDQGLETRWMITSAGVELAALPGDAEVSAGPLASVPGWKASFSLLIPKEGESAVPRLRITPRSAQNATLEVVIHARHEIYRRLTIQLAIERPEEEPATITREISEAPARHLDLKTQHEWTTPPGTLTLTILGDRAAVRGTIGAWQEVEDIVEWFGGDGQIAGRIVNLRAAAEKLRTRTESYLNAIDPAELLQRLASFEPQYDWGDLRLQADPTHDEQWAKVAVSPELRDLAFHGYNLYNSFFPKGRSPLRDWLDSLYPGHRINVSWLRGSGAGWLAHVPWGLMYRSLPPPVGQPVDAMSFLGLRFRIAYSSRPQLGTKALGRVEDTVHAHLMYWGDDAPTGPESLWQRALWKDWGRQVFLPPLPAPADPKSGLIQLLDSPSSESPLTVLYLFCNCTVGDGNEPVLRFANTNQPSALLRQTELGLAEFTDQPLVFANACTTASADPYFANELATNFFERGCRAFLGTETKVPIELASRFAAIFFHFFFRKVDPSPMAAGEAVAQTRLFLWTQYRNLGGLFYTYINRYELFMARDEEVAALRF